MNDWPASIVIVGGGTAGWLAALMLGDAAKRQQRACDITVVESSRIGTVGVGEGTTAVFRQMLQYLGVDEFEFLRETDASIKLGIRHRDWRKLGHHYDGPIDDPHQVSRAPAGVAASTPYLDLLAVGRGRSVTDCHLFQPLMEKQCSPFSLKASRGRAKGKGKGHGPTTRTRESVHTNTRKIPQTKIQTTTQSGTGSSAQSIAQSAFQSGTQSSMQDRLTPLGPFHHAYHFDQAKAGQYLRSRTTGVTVIDDQVSGVKRDANNGDVTCLHLERGSSLSAELYLDCTGFRRALIKELGASWQSFTDVLPVNRAMPFWLDIEDGEEIAPYTLAWAQKAGWLWKIPTRERYGCGYVYSDNHTSREQAQAEIESVLGQAIEPRNDISIDAGRLDESWLHNVVALGLSSSFLEPLEATSIHGTVVQLMLLVQQLESMDSGKKDTAIARLNYNQIVGGQVDDFRDFIRLHYVSERRDTPFWQDVANSLPQGIEQRLARWQKKVPGAEDFSTLGGGLPHLGHQLYTPVLDGLGLLNKEAASSQLQTTKGLRQHARKTSDSLTQEYRRASAQAIGHRAFLDLIQQDFDS